MSIRGSASTFANSRRLLDQGRTTHARARAETALVRLLYQVCDDEPLLVVLGGLVPDALTRRLAGVVPQHVETTDVDARLITHVAPELDLSAIERALERLNFDPDASHDAWR